MLIFFGLGGLAPYSLIFRLLAYCVRAGVCFLIFFTFITELTSNGMFFCCKCIDILGILIIPNIMAVRPDLR